MCAVRVWLYGMCETNGKLLNTVTHRNTHTHTHTHTHYEYHIIEVQG